MKPDFDQIARQITNMPVGLLKMRQPISDALRAAYASGLERAAEIVGEMDQTHFALEEIIPTILAEKEADHD
jgi:hypothetical protein